MIIFYPVRDPPAGRWVENRLKCKVSSRTGRYTIVNYLTSTHIMFLTEPKNKK